MIWLIDWNDTIVSKLTNSTNNFCMRKTFNHFLQYNEKIFEKLQQIFVHQTKNMKIHFLLFRPHERN